MNRLDRNVYAVLLVAAVVAVLPTAARGQSGVQYSRDGRRAYVSKDIGPERWSITRERATGSVSGLVFFPGGGDPLFVECDQRFDDGQTVGLACYGANKCEAAQCSSDAWSFISDVELPAAFFASGGTSPPPPPGESPCKIYGDRCPAEPTDFEAAGGEITFDNYGSQSGGNASWVRALILPQSSSGTLVIQGGTIAQPQLVMGFSGTGEVGARDGRLVFANTDGPGGALCIDASGARAPTIRAIEERVDFCAICEVGSPIVGRFSGRYQIASGAECAVSGEFRMFRAR